MKRLALLAAAVMVAALLPAGIASASPHSPPEDSHTECDVDGSVTLDIGVDSNRKNDHYTFVDTSLTCTSGPTAPRDYSGVYTVGAEGDTTGYFHGDQNLGGEDCEQGGSAQDNGEYHTGMLTAERNSDGFQINGAGPNNESVHFVRLGAEVLADGPLTDEDGNEGYFFAELVFIPTDGDCVTGPIVEASLVGTAVIKEGHDHVCGEENSAADLHCIL